MPDPDPSEKLKELDARIAAVKKAQEPGPRMDEHYSMAEAAWRMVVELVAGLAVGFCIGIGLDYLLGTQPLFLVLFTLLGFAAGVLSMMRSAKEIQKDAEARAASDDAET